MTTPPARYTEASLIKALEDLGIGRPSTYSSIIKTIQDRGYIYKKGSALVPAWVAFAVVGLLEQHFGRLVDYDFTASMERDLDRIAAGEEDRVAWLRRFYNGQGASGAAVDETASTAGELDAAAAPFIPPRARIFGTVDSETTSATRVTCTTCVSTQHLTPLPTGRPLRPEHRSPRWSFRSSSPCRPRPWPRPST